MGFTPLGSDYLAEIGRIAANFAILENDLSSGIGQLLALDETDEKIVTAELSFRGKMNLFDSLYRERISDEPLRDELVRVIKILGHAEEKRNQILHSTWAVEVDASIPMSPLGVLSTNTDEVMRIKRTAKQGKGLKEQGEIMTTFDLKNIADEIDLAGRAVDRLMESSFPAT
jgi:hypothetical protein